MIYVDDMRREAKLGRWPAHWSCYHAGECA
jgi:hypothetical protein